MAITNDLATLTTPTTLLAAGPVTLLPGGPATLLAPDNTGNGLTPLPVGTGAQTLIWQGGTANNDPTNAANWNPNVAPQMAANQTLVMNSGTMNLNGGNLAANQLNVSTAADKSATINLTDHGTLDLNVPDTAIPNVNVNMAGGGEAVLNVFAGPNSDPDIDVKIDASKLDLQANMSFGKLDVDASNGGKLFLQGDSHLNGSSVTLNTGLDGFGSVELASSGTHPGRMDLTSPLPAGVTVTAQEHTPGAGANGLVFEHSADSTTPGGLITLNDAFVKLRGSDATSYTQTGNEFDLFKNGVKVDVLDIAAGTGSTPLLVASNVNGIYIYNADPSTMPLGAGNGLGGGGGGGGGTGPQMALVATPDVASSLSPLPMHG